MLPLVLLALVAAQAAPQATPVIGAVSVTVLDRTGLLVSDLRAEEVTVTEEGAPREIVRVARDARPLALALLLDSSDYWGRSFLRDLADPAFDFLEALPAGTDRTLMTIGTPPEVIDLTDLAQARIALKAKLPAGKLSLYDGFAEACQRLGTKAGARRIVVVALSDRTTEEDRQMALDAAGRTFPQVFAVQFQSGQFAIALDSIVQWSGGRYEQIGAPSGLGKTLKKLLPELEAPWLVMYKTPSALEKRKVEVKVSRKGTKVRWRSAGL